MPSVVEPKNVGDGASLYPAYFRGDQAEDLAKSVWELASPHFVSPVTPSGKPFSVQQTNFGALGWISDRRGYRYEPHHPESQKPWPSIPAVVLCLWQDLIGGSDPECCLVNYYTDSAKMGLHQDRDEDDQEAPILSISLGQEARFRLGGPNRNSPTRSFVLGHGDVLVMAGHSRRAFHGIDRLLPASLMSPAGLPFPGRLSLTLRRVTLPA